MIFRIEMKRINIVGTSASGKTTFSRQLANKLNLAYIELDDLFWQDDWEASSDAVFFDKIQKQIEHAKVGYVIDGNYTRTQNIKWQEVDVVIWLDLPFHVNLFRSVKRALHRLLTQKQLWENSNNKENLRLFLSRDSIVLWMIKTHAKNRKKYFAMMNDPQYSHIRFVRLRSRKQTKQFLDRLK